VTALPQAAATLGALALAAYAVAVLRRWIAHTPKAMVAPLREAMTIFAQQDSIPAGIDHFLFRSAPVIAFVAMALAALFVPASAHASGVDSSVGLFFFLALFAPFVVAMMNAGWAQGGKAGLFGAFRAAAHLLSYEVPLGFAAIGPVMAAESLSTSRIVEGQHALWYGVWQPLGLALYLVAAVFASFRHPCDLPQADTELAGGTLAEYSGPSLLLFRVALNANFALLMVMGVVLFLGGWQGPLLPGPIWLALKSAALAGLVLAVARRFPRLRHDQMLAFSWKVLLPASLLNVLLVGVLALVLPGSLQ
jgi:NADH-quinone oxidoreductase subunit H